MGPQSGPCTRRRNRIWIAAMDQVMKRADRPLEGVLWMLASGVSFVGVQGIVRHLGTDLPAAQSAFLRFLFGLVFLAPLLARYLRQGLRAGTLRLYALRGVAHTAAVVLWFYAMARIPVAHVTAIGYLSPVIVLVAAALLLGERLTRRRVLTVLVAFGGALIVLRPGVQALQLGHLAQIGAAICFAGSYLIGKRLAGVAEAGIVVAMLTLTVTLGLLPLAVAVWVPVSAVQVGWLAVVAALATLGHYLMSRAFQAAPLAVTQPVAFVQLVWATALGALIFHEPVDGFVLLGGGLIIAAISALAWAEAWTGARREAVAEA